MNVEFHFDGASLVTGGGSGIGRSIAVELGRAGSPVCLVDLNEAGCEETKAQIEAVGGRAIVVAANVADPEAMAAAVKRCVDELGPLKYGVNAAGIANAEGALEMGVEQWDTMYEVDVKGVFVSSQAEARAMVETGGGSIVNIASMSGTIVNRGLLQAHYNSAKAAVAHYSRSIAMELVDRGIRVNALSPGYCATPMNTRPEVAEQAKQFAADTPMGRMGEPEEMAPPTLFLLSDGASFITGVDLLVDGGFCCW